MAKQTLTVKVHVAGIRGTLRAFNALPKDASKRLREETLKLAEILAARARADGVADADPRSKLLAGTVKAVKDRAPAVQAGGTARLGRRGFPAYAVLFGSVFGMNARSGWFAGIPFKSHHGHQYREHRGRNAYWFFPVVEESSAEIGRAWNRVAAEIARDFAEGGDT